MNFFSSALVFLSLRRTTDDGGLPTFDTKLPVAFDVALFDVDATEASLSLLDSPGDALRFLRFLLGRPFNLGAGNDRKFELQINGSTVGEWRISLTISLRSQRTF